MIILTGASQGIGKKIISQLAKIDQVVGIYNKTRPPVPTDSRISYEKVNLEEPEEIKSFVKRLAAKLNRLTVIQAAALSIDGLAADYLESSWDSVFNVNLKANFILTQALLPHMIYEKWGRIVHISSIVGMQGQKGTIAYSASKSGLVGVSRVLAKEYARFNITSNILALGYFEVGLIDTLNEDEKKMLLGQVPSKKFGKVSNIVLAIDFLMKSEYVNGAVINIDGGI